MDWLGLLKNSQETDEPLYVQITNRLKRKHRVGKACLDRSQTYRRIVSWQVCLEVDRSTVSRAYAELDSGWFN